MLHRSGDGFAGADIPEACLAWPIFQVLRESPNGFTTDGDQPAAVRAKGDKNDFLTMRQGSDGRTCARIPNGCRMVFTGRGDEPAIGTESCPLDFTCVLHCCSDLSAGRSVLKARGLVPTAGEN